MENLQNQYKPSLYEKIKHNGYNFAKIIIPELKKIITINSVLDVGCGGGSFLRGCYEQNLSIMGIDGSHVESSLQVEKKYIKYLNLEESFDLNKKFDLCVSLEVAEHIDLKYSDNFVNSICLHSNHVLFSAAQVGQPGINHINCQPIDFWVEKFKNNGFLLMDYITMWIRSNNSIYNWYRKNSLVFKKK